MLGTLLRPDGVPRISPLEPAFFEGVLWIGGMLGTAKFEELLCDPRGRGFDHFLCADVTGAASVWVGDGHMDLTV